MNDDTPPAVTAGSSDTQMYFASANTDATLTAWLDSPAASELFSAAFDAAAQASLLITITVPGVGAFDLVNLIDQTHNYDYVIRRATNAHTAVRTERVAVWAAGTTDRRTTYVTTCACGVTTDNHPEHVATTNARGDTDALAKPDAFRAVETALRVLGIDRTLHPTLPTHDGPYWYAVLSPPPELRRRRLMNGNYLSDDGDGVVREWDRKTSQLVNVDRYDV